MTLQSPNPLAETQPADWIEFMTVAALLDLDAVVRLCERHSVQRLRIFGSALTDRFAAGRSDVDFLVEFLPTTSSYSDAYFGLQEDLTELLGHDVDLVMVDAIQNPYFAREAEGTAQELYAA